VNEALLSAFVALLVSAIGGVVSFRLQRDRLRQENRTEFMAEQALVELLDHKDWTLRSFTAIQKRVGGFGDDALRQLLVRAGALCFEGKYGPYGENGASARQEMWGLRRNNADLLNRSSRSVESADR
jgi:hypothetical protein